MRGRFVTSALPLTLAAILAAACGRGPVDVEAEPPEHLAAWGLFQGNGSTQEPARGVLPYDLNTPLFSDYAVKYRFVRLPPGKPARYNESETFELPVGTVLVKTFAFLHQLSHPEKGRRLVETRLLVHRQEGWIGLPYVWNEGQSDALLQVAGTTRLVRWVHRDGRARCVDYIVPNTNQCLGCHIRDKAMQPIGIKARHLNRDFDYAEGRHDQLGRWSRDGLLSGAPASEKAPRLPVWDRPETGSVEARARAWLEVNCAHCHNPRGPAASSGLDLMASQTEPVRFGVLKTPVAAGRGSGGRLYDIVPGKPDESILVYRIESTDPGVMMPELPRRLVDEEGVALIRAWIASLPEGGSRVERVAHRPAHLLQAIRLADEAHGALGEERLGLTLGGMARGHEHPRFGIDGLQARQGLSAAHPGHAEVQDHQADAAPFP
jgi:uncharacterized repeat protein (TIGR03806 family)